MSKLVKSLPPLGFVVVMGYFNTNLVTHAISPVYKPSSTSISSTQARKPDTLSDTQVIPGVRVGPVTRNTTRQDLAKRFGAARLKDQPINIGEGETEPGTHVELGSQRSFSVVWTDASRSKAKEIRCLGSDWRTPQGIGVGTSLTQLQQKLGTFKFYGFAWDYAGTVLLEGTRLAQYDQKLILRLRIAPDAAEKSPNDFKAVMGERQFSSNNPHLRSLKPEVGEMIVQLAVLR